MQIIYIYLTSTMENIAQPMITEIEDFKENPSLFYPDWDSETMKFSATLLKNPFVDEVTGGLREMTKEKLYAIGKYSLAPNELLEDGKIKSIELSEFEYIENNQIKLKRDKKIEEIKNKLEELKDKKIRKGVKVKEGIYHPTRDTDKVNLIIAKERWTGNIRWKFYDENGNGVLEDLTLEIIEKIFSDGEKVLNGAILGELEAENALEKMTDEEIKNIDIEAHFEKYYKKLGGI